jgi:HEPN domain-containing protein
MTRALDASRGKDYFTKAKNSVRMANIAIQEKAYDNSVMSAIHGAINALDALTTSYLGKRSSGEHTNTLALVKGILTQKEYAETAKQFSSLMTMKNTSEYQPDLTSQSDAEKAVKWAERIVTRVAEKLKGLENS